MFANLNACTIESTIKSRTIFNLPSSSILSKQARYVFTANNGSKYVQIDLDNKIMRWGSINNEQYSFVSIEKACPSSSDVIDVILSPKERFICLACNKSISIIEIPWTFESVENISDAIQNVYYDIAEAVDIKKVIFHPKAANDDELVILYHNDLVCLYDFTEDIKLFLNEETAKLGIQDRITSIRDVAFSQDGLTLYLLSVEDGGDVYALYPCLPSHLSISKDELDILLNKSIILYNNLKKDTNANIKKNVVKQLQFVTKLINEKEKDKNLENTYITYEVEKVHRLIRPQGPFTIDPFPEKLYNSVAKSLHVIGIEGNNEIVALLFDDNTILFLFKDLEHSMMWDSPSYFFNNSFVLIEDFKFPSKNSISFLTSSSECGKCLVKDSKNIIQIDTTSWSSALSKCIVAEDLTSLIDVNFKSQIHDYHIDDNINSCAVWKYKGYIGNIFASNLKVYVKTFDFVKPPEQSKGDLAKTFTKECYKAGFTQPIAEIALLNSQYQKECKAITDSVVSPDDRQVNLKNSANEKQLEILTDISQKLMGKILKGQSLGLTLRNRISEEQLEMTRQLKISSNILNKQKCASEKLGIQELKWRKQLQRQHELIERFVKLNNNLNKIETSDSLKSMDISVLENSWFKEIRSHAIKFNEIVRKQSATDDDLNYIKKELKIMEVKSKELSSVKQNEWASIRDMLKADSEIIRNTIQR